MKRQKRHRKKKPGDIKKEVKSFMFAFMQLPDSIRGSVFKFFIPVDLIRMRLVSKSFLQSSNEVGAAYEDPAHQMLDFSSDREAALDQWIDKDEKSKESKLTDWHRRLLRIGKQITILDHRLFKLIRMEILLGNFSLREAIQGIHELLESKPQALIAKPSDFAKRVMNHLFPWQRQALAQNHTFEELLTGQAIIEFMEFKEDKISMSFDKAALIPLKSYQKMGLFEGFTLEDVTALWFTPIHIEAILQGIAPDRLRDLSPEQVLSQELKMDITDDWSIATTISWPAQSGMIGILSQALRSMGKDNPDFIKGCFEIGRGVLFEPPKGQTLRAVRYFQHFGRYTPSEWDNLLTKMYYEGSLLFLMAKANKTPFDPEAKTISIEFLEEMMSGISPRRRRQCFEARLGVFQGEPVSLFRLAIMSNNSDLLRWISSSYTREQWSQIIQQVGLKVSAFKAYSSALSFTVFPPPQKPAEPTVKACLDLVIGIRYSDGESRLPESIDSELEMLREAQAKGALSPEQKIRLCEIFEELRKICESMGSEATLEF